MMEEMSVVPEVESLPYLLLDVRDEDAFKQCHIIGGEYKAILTSSRGHINRVNL